MDKKNFEIARDKIINEERIRRGIGTLSEKSLHAVLKNYCEINEDYHEIPIDRFVADIYKNDEIIEIQTAHFNKLREKLQTFLLYYDVTVVYPIARKRYISLINPDTGEKLSRRKSPINGNPYFIFPELYKIKNFLKNERLHFKIVMIDLEEFRLIKEKEKKRGRRKGYKKGDVFPIELADEFDVKILLDYIQFIPYELEDGFTSLDFAKAASINRALSQITLNILDFVGAVKRIGKKGNNYTYSVVEQPEEK